MSARDEIARSIDAALTAERDARERAQREQVMFDAKYAPFVTAIGNDPDGPRDAVDRVALGVMDTRYMLLHDALVRWTMAREAHARLSAMRDGLEQAMPRVEPIRPETAPEEPSEEPPARQAEVTDG